MPSARSAKRKSGLSLESFMRILDLGCGSGRGLASWDGTAADEVAGLDIDDRRLANRPQNRQLFAQPATFGTCRTH